MVSINRRYDTVGFALARCLMGGVLSERRCMPLYVTYVDFYVLKVLPATPISEASCCHCSGIFVTYRTSPALVETEERKNDHRPANHALLRLCFSKPSRSRPSLNFFVVNTTSSSQTGVILSHLAACAR
jgi:hypothetical protein